jgi:hypothetical protein
MRPFNLKECMNKHGGKCVTRDGREAQIIMCDVNNHNGYSTIAIIKGYNGSEFPLAYKPTGKFSGSGESNADLFLPPIKHTITGFLNVYSSTNTVVFHPEKRMADICAQPDRTACVPFTIEVEEGQGL